MMIEICNPEGHAIESVDDWFRLAPPAKREEHWVDGRSAKELAKAFLRPALPAELQALLQSSNELGSIEIKGMTPELRIKIDAFSGNHPNADLAGLGSCDKGDIGIVFEGKADEEFNELLSVVLANPKAGSNIPKRVSNLTNAVLSTGFDPARVRYQLLYGVASALCFARNANCKTALYIVYEFRGQSCRDENLERNARDLQYFLSCLNPPFVEPLPTGRLIGPFMAQGSGMIPAMPFYMGKVVQTCS